MRENIAIDINVPCADFEFGAIGHFHLKCSGPSFVFAFPCFIAHHSGLSIVKAFHLLKEVEQEKEGKYIFTFKRVVLRPALYSEPGCL